MDKDREFNSFLNKGIGVLAFEFAIEISGKENQFTWSVLALIIVFSLAKVLADTYPQKQKGFVEFIKQIHIFIIGYVSLLFVLGESF